MKRYDRRTRLVLGLVLLVSGLAYQTQGAAVPDAERQGSMLKRIFSYDKHLRASDKIIVLIVAADRDAAEVTDITAVFRANGLYPAVVTPDDLANEDLTATHSPESTVVYIVNGVEVGKVKDFAASKGFLTVSAQPLLAEAGHVSVSVDVEGERPEIIVNLPRLQTERHELSSELLNLARVIR